jgi:hypothetical protein
MTMQYAAMYVQYAGMHVQYYARISKGIYTLSSIQRVVTNRNVPT